MNMLESLNNAIYYIEENLLSDIEYGKIAQVAGYSQYHFQRLFVSSTNIPLSEYIRRRRLTLAAMDLQKGEEKVIDIAMRYGYNSPDSFTRAFKNLHDISPSKAREHGANLKAYPPIIFTLTLKGVEPMNYRIEEKQSFRIVGIKERTSVENGENTVSIPEMWQKMPRENYYLIGSCANTEPTGIIGVCGETYNNKFDYWIAAATTKECPESLSETTIPASTWAVFECIGPMPGAIQDVWKRILSEWFPTSGYEHAGTPDFEWYSDGDNTKADYKSEVWIPVKKKS